MFSGSIQQLKESDTMASKKAIKSSVRNEFFINQKYSKACWRLKWTDLTKIKKTFTVQMSRRWVPLFSSASWVRNSKPTLCCFKMVFPIGKSPQLPFIPDFIYLPCHLEMSFESISFLMPSTFVIRFCCNAAHSIFGHRLEKLRENWNVIVLRHVL